MGDDLHTRVQALEDRLAIFELEGIYARAFDSRDGAAWAALFSEDGIYQARGATPHGGGSFAKGRAQLAEFCRTANYDGLHFLHLPQITFDGDRATSRVHLDFAGVFHGSDAPMIRMIGYYDVSYVRVDGRWLIERRVTTTFARDTRQNFGYPAASGLS